MNKAIENLKKVQEHAMKVRPKVEGYPYLAEVLRSAGVKKNIWSLPSCQSFYRLRVSLSGRVSCAESRLALLV